LRDPNEDPNLLRLDFWRFFRLIFSVHRKDATTAPPPPTSRRPNPTASVPAAGSDGAGAASSGAGGGNVELRGSRDVYADPARFFARKPGESDATPSSGSSPGAPGNWSDQGPFLTEYNPVTFRAVRATYGVADDAYRDAWQEDGLELKVNEGGASEAFFFFSADKRFIVKSCTVSEMTLLRNMATEYAGHLARCAFGAGFGSLSICFEL